MTAKLEKLFLLQQPYFYQILNLARNMEISQKKYNIENCIVSMLPYCKRPFFQSLSLYF